MADIESLYSLLKERRLRWLGHVRRIEDGRIPKNWTEVTGPPTAILQKCLQEGPSWLWDRRSRVGSSSGRQGWMETFSENWDCQQQERWGRGKETKKEGKDYRLSELSFAKPGLCLCFVWKRLTLTNWLVQPQQEVLIAPLSYHTGSTFDLLLSLQ